MDNQHTYQKSCDMDRSLYICFFFFKKIPINFFAIEQSLVCGPLSGCMFPSRASSFRLPISIALCWDSANAEVQTN